MVAMAAQAIMQVQALPPVVAVALVGYLPFHLVLVLAVSAAYMCGKHFIVLTGSLLRHLMRRQ